METPEQRKANLPKLEKTKKPKSNKKHYIDYTGKRRSIGSWGRARTAGARAWMRNQEQAILAGVEKKIGKAGHVYVFSLGYGDLYKIGCTANVMQRLKHLQASNPQMKCVWSAWVKDMHDVEKKLHNNYKVHRVDREIFKLDAKNIVAINNFVNSIKEAY